MLLNDQYAMMLLVVLFFFLIISIDLIGTVRFGSNKEKEENNFKNFF